MAIIDIKNLAKRFGKVQALKNINLEVNQGDIYGFIGPNGAGKTTTIRTLLGIIKADQGEASIFGLDAWEDAVKIHENIAYVPGDVKLWPNLTGGEVIDILLGLRGVKQAARKEALIEQFNLDPTKKCRSYSKGNRQKVALIAAFASDAELFILDEPTSGLDPLMEKVFQSCIETLKKEKKTVLLSSHILSEVEKLCDKVSIIRQGEIIESGSIKDLRHLTRLKINLEAKKVIPDLEKQSGVFDVIKEDYQYWFEVDPSALTDLMKYIATYDIIKIESMPPTLEALFMRHYEEA